MPCLPPVMLGGGCDLLVSFLVNSDGSSARFLPSVLGDCWEG